MAIWGMSFIWSKIVFEYLPPVSTILARLILSSLFLWLWLAFIRKLRIPKKKDFVALIILALLQPFVYFIGESFGLQRTTAVVSAVIIALIPVFTPIFAAMLGQERLGWQNVLGLLISFLGVGIIVSSKGFQVEADYIGILFLLLAVLAAIAYTLWVKKIGLGLSGIEVIAWQNTIGIFLFIPLFLWLDIDVIPLQAIEPRMWLSLLSLSVLASSLAFIFYFDSVRKLGPSRSNVFSNLITVFTAIMAWIILGEHLTLSKISGIVIVIAGVLLTQRKTSISLNR
jgi:drug/metabolite transporter (DMT)-like permease